MGKVIKKAVLICTVLAILMCYLPLLSFSGSVSPHRALHVEKNDISNHMGNLLPQEWGPKKTTVISARSLSTPPFHTGVSIQTELVSTKPSTGGIFATVGAERVASGHTYLHNLSLRC
jgi:hypothetical protein